MHHSTIAKYDKNLKCCPINLLVDLFNYLFFPSLAAIQLTWAAMATHVSVPAAGIWEAGMMNPPGVPLGGLNSGE